MEKRSKAERMNMPQSRAFLRRLRATECAHGCEYGHLDCSDIDGGACMDEVLGNYPSLADESWEGR